MASHEPKCKWPRNAEPSRKPQSRALVPIPAGEPHLSPRPTSGAFVSWSLPQDVFRMATVRQPRKGPSSRAWTGHPRVGHPAQRFSVEFQPAEPKRHVSRFNVISLNRCSPLISVLQSFNCRAPAPGVGYPRMRGGRSAIWGWPLISRLPPGDGSEISPSHRCRKNHVHRFRLRYWSSVRSVEALTIPASAAYAPHPTPKLLIPS